MKWLFDAMTDVFRSMSPSVYAFVEATLPYTTPLPIALISANSANTFFGLSGVGAFAFVYSLEGIGLVTTTRLVETIVDSVRSRNVKSWIVVIVLVLVVFAYVRILVNLNVNMHEEYGDVHSEVLTLVSYLPLIAGVLNGMGLMKLSSVQEKLRQEEKEDERWEKERQDRKEIRLAQIEAKRAALASGTAPAPQSVTTAVPSDYKQVVFDLLDANNGNVGLTEITKYLNDNYQTGFVHEKVKGTWHKYVAAWRQANPRGNP